MPTPPPPPEPPANLGDISLAELEERYKQDLIRHAREQEAYDAAVAARQHAEQYAHAMGFGAGMGIPPGYSPSSGDLDQQGVYGLPYAYAEATPPPEERNMVEGAPGLAGDNGESQNVEAGPPPSEIGDEAMDTDGPNGGETRTRAGDGRHEGG